MGNYDSWKTTNPADEFLGPNPADEPSEQDLLDDELDKTQQEAHLTKFSDIKVGDILTADGGFSCIHEGHRCDVHSDDIGNLYIMCCGSGANTDDLDATDSKTKNTYDVRHFLAGQVDWEGNLIGLTKVTYRAGL